MTYYLSEVDLNADDVYFSPNPTDDLEFCDIHGETYYWENGCPMCTTQNESLGVKNRNSLSTGCLYCHNISERGPEGYSHSYGPQCEGCPQAY